MVRYKLMERVLFIGFLALLILMGSIIVIDYYVSSIGSIHLYNIDEVPEVDAIIVFGAYVFPDGRVSTMLRDRLDYGYKLYQLKNSDRILVSGDNGQVGYDEVNGMREYLQAKGVPREHIFMDHAGFNSYDSLYRARDIFEIDKAILVSQEYHLERALYIADRLGIEAYGVASDPRTYTRMRYYRFREVGARFKAFLQAGILKPEPRYLGETIPIWNSGELTDNGKS
ncbi:SanA/YdcF family protein [Natronospora cellulosivora (SeqCode)]